MEKIIVWCIFSVALLAQTDSLENSCLACHKSEQIPSHMIYKKYLLKYSSKARIEAAMYKYLKSPKKSNSVMPPQ
ncbi:MAG: hypothetical protein L3J43_11810, partial [Sulfurovum sp.]|nr:hypothetical protein [Sulfurovum sp.]